MKGVEHRINRTPELAAELAAIKEEKGLSTTALSQEAGVCSRLVGSMLHPEWTGVVSKESASLVIEALVEDPEQRIKILGLAGISVWYSRLNPDILFELL